MALLVPRMYSGFRGVDFRGEECELFRSPDSVNMWRDYKETDSVRTRPGLKLLAELPHEFVEINGINGMYFYNDALIVHCDNALYEVKDGNIKYFYGDGYGFTVKDNKSHGFVYEDKFYFMDGENYLRYDGENWTSLFATWADLQPLDVPLDGVHSYIPTTSIGRKPAGGGTPYEDVNMLCQWRCNTFIGDGESTDYYLDTKEFIAKRAGKSYIKVWVDGVETNEFFVLSTDEGIVRFDNPPPKPATDGQDNVVIKFCKPVSGYAEKILGCTLSQVFDNRVFVTGNPNYPNMVWHCSLNDPTYFSDLDYYREGLDDAKITGMVAGNNALWVFREPSDANTTVFYHTPTIDDQYGKIYPSTHSSVTLGCVGKAINFNDDIVFFSQRGMEGISGDITTEQVAAHRSSLVDRKLLAEAGYKNMVLAEWEGYLMVFVGDKAYIADSRTAFTIENHIEYEWFYWDFSKDLWEHSSGRVSYAAVHDGVLYLGAGNCIYTLTDMEADVESYWVTPKDKFQYPHKLKTTSKRGCVVEATTGVPPLWQGDISVYVKTDKTDFEQVGTYTNVKDYFVSRIKMKKFKDLQLKFQSGTRFSLESATMECFVGGYIKR